MKSTAVVSVYTSIAAFASHGGIVGKRVALGPDILKEYIVAVVQFLPSIWDKKRWFV